MKKDALPERLRRAASSTLNWGVLLVISAALIVLYAVMQPDAVGAQLVIMLAVTEVAGIMLVVAGVALRYRRNWARRTAFAACLLTAAFIVWQIVIAVVAAFHQPEIEAAVNRQIVEVSSGVLSESDVRALQEMESRFIVALDVVIGVVCVVLVWWLVKVLLTARYLRSDEAKSACAEPPVQKTGPEDPGPG
ncbi:MAG TPA: hypothetical protein VMY39_02590 [Planctomycetota bacterium]|nr:hypothetical protein [Planctomycetota bacterium]